MDFPTILRWMHCWCSVLLFLPVAWSAELPSAPGTNVVWTSGRHHLTFEGRERAFLLDVPRQLRPGAPLVMVFHGFTGSAKEVRELAGFTPLVEQHGFVAVYPEGTTDAKGRTFFQVGYQFHQDQKVDDVQFTRGLAARLVRDLGLDERAVFATGFSNGADLSFFLGAQSQPFVTAIAPVAGTMMESWARDFRPARRISVLAVNTKDDPTTRWEGDLKNQDGWGAYLGTESVIDLWVKGLALPQVQRDVLTPNLHRTRWSGVDDRVEVEFYALAKGGHVWPQHLGEGTRTTAETIWEFFDRHRPRSR
jgi:polyhydroxybutyrate depolymerase